MKPITFERLLALTPKSCLWMLDAGVPEVSPDCTPVDKACGEMWGLWHFLHTYSLSPRTKKETLYSIEEKIARLDSAKEFELATKGWWWLR